MDHLLNILIPGLILGGIYALIAVGLSLQYGVGRVLNVSHGEFIILGALITASLFTTAGINPFLVIVIVTPVFFGIGFGIDRTMFNKLRRTSPNDDAFEGRSLLASFGVLFIVQNLMLMYWGPNIIGYSYLTTSVTILGQRYGLNRVTALVVSVVVCVGFLAFIRWTRLGKAIRASAEVPEIADALGVNRKLVMATCFGLGTALAGLAGVLYSLMFDLQGSRGIELTIIAIVVVVFGGLGSISGSLIGGFALGLLISMVNYFDPSLSLVAFYLVLILVLLLKPSGILGRQLHAD
ncbi:MAG: branched-chain amino acid ABC transporter permease [Acidimicrobiia bacterium]|nr:branched-chain amino acid ABC transporter permease [Acidimicrobiia bacterium]